ncbi:MAG: hypothetical protein U1E29_08015 [Coriobacteriia bacterium]|nr:hypothetical protein [Coriobacteriia bacterium]
MSDLEISCFLLLVREAYRTNRFGYRKDGRKVSMDTLAELGLSPRDMLERIAALRPEDALNAPWPNRNRAHSDEMVCDFGIYVDDTPVYIKISVRGTDAESRGFVISFHVADRPFNSGARTD